MQEMQEMWVRSLGQEDALERGSLHTRVLAWRVPWTEEAGGRGYSPWGHKSQTPLSDTH